MTAMWGLSDYKSPAAATDWKGILPPLNLIYELTMIVTGGMFIVVMRVSEMVVLRRRKLDILEKSCRLSWP